MDRFISHVPDGRATSAVIAAAIGDALGWPHEHNNQRIRRRASEEREAAFGGFEEWTRKVGGRFYASEERVGPGEYSDDTQLIICTARSFSVAGEHWFDHFTKAELPAWLLYERGGGRATKMAANLWAKGTPPWMTRDQPALHRYYEAGGNGVAMRVLPHVIARMSTPPKLQRDVLLNGIATHGHPRGLVGALIYAEAVRIALAKDGMWRLGELIEAIEDSAFWRSPPDASEFPAQWLDHAFRCLRSDYFGIWDQTIAEVQGQLRIAREGLRRGALAVDHDVLDKLGAFGKQSGAGTVTSVSAIYLASRHAASPATGVRTAAYALRADTDTLASMTAALFGAMLGNEWIPAAWQDVQDASYIRSLVEFYASADKFADDAPLLFQPAEAWTERDTKRFRLILQRGNQSRIDFGPLGSVERIKGEVLPTRVRHLTTTRWQLRTMSGQTIFVTLFAKEPASPPQPETSPRETLTPKSVVHPDRIIAQVATLSETVGNALTAADLLRVLEAILRKISETAGPTGDQGQLPPKPEIRAWLQDAVAARHLPSLSDDVLLSLARLAWRIIYGAHARLPQNGQMP